MDPEVEKLLAHHGIKGMRWGIRRARATGAAADKARAQFLQDRAKLHGKTLSKEDAFRRVHKGRQAASAILAISGALSVAAIVSAAAAA